jgi:hypothetical protein
MRSSTLSRHYSNEHERQTMGRPVSTRKCSIDGCDRKHAARGWCSAHWQAWNRYGSPNISLGQGGSQRGPNSNNWHGENLGYSGVHRRLTRERGPASGYECLCGKPAQQWAYSNVCGDEKSDVAGPAAGSPFCVHLDCYEPLCCSCHKLKDDDRFRTFNALLDSARGENR